MKDDIVRLGVGTIDGAYILSSEDRSTWNKTRPLMKGESVNYMISSPEGRLFASTLSDGIFIALCLEDPTAIIHNTGAE